jgi:glycosyltransferase involved in cell wall biosynthesis
MAKLRVLLMMQLPPPYHGAAIVNSRLAESKRLNCQFKIDILPVQLAREIGDVGKPSFRKAVLLLSLVARLFSQLLFRRPSVVLYTVPSTGVAFVGAILLIVVLRCFRVAHVLQMRSRGIAETAKRSILHRLAVRWAFARAAVILYSPRVLDDVAQFVKPEQIWYLPDGIPDPVIGTLKERGRGETHILFLSHLFESKGMMVFLEALAILKHQGAKFKATLAGEPGDISHEALTARITFFNLSSEVCYTGAVYGVDKEALYLAADIFALPTFYPLEAFPGVLLEAMAYGLPIITTDHAAIPDIVTNDRTGYVVPPRNAVVLADALLRLIRDPELRQKMGKAARKEFKNRYLFSRYEDRLASILQECIQNRATA